LRFGMRNALLMCLDEGWLRRSHENMRMAAVKTVSKKKLWIKKFDDDRG